MSSSAKEDQERRDAPGNIEEPDVMTIEFLRARLLSERAVSKSARQRADELAKRVSELEDQLKFVSLQRKKAEKATSDILKILENNGITGVSKECYSHSDEEETPDDFNSSSKGSVMNNGGQSPSKVAVVINESEMHSCSEVDSCPSTGRSLSWKSGKNPQLSLEKKKRMEFVRRRAGFGSYGSSSCRRAGKSCRRIKHRSVEELQNESEREASSKDASTCSGDDIKRLSIENGNNEDYQDEREEENMESALERQARLIGRYEDEENAQREWEEKYRKNNGGTQDSCDPGNHSDVTEERHSTHSSPKDPSKEARAIENPDPNDGNKATTKGESSASEFSFPTSEERNKLGEFGFNNRRHRSLPTDASSNGYEGERNTSQQNLLMVPRGASNDLGSVMDALHRAKLSLNHQMNRSAKPEYGRARLPVSSSRGLFRLPDEHQLLETSRTECPGTGFSSTTPSFEPGKNGDHRSNLFLSDPFAYGPFERSSPSFPTSQPMNLPGIHTEPSNYLNSSYMSPIHPSVRGLYPFLPTNAAALSSSPFNSEASSSKSRPNTYHP